MTRNDNAPGKKEEHAAVDLFCGGGGLSLGIEEAGFVVKFAVDAWEPAIQTYNHNRPGTIGRVTDVSTLSGNKIKDACKTDDIALVAGGPPCPGFSLAGKRNVMDSRNLMVDEFFRIIDEIQPMYFLMENVVGMKSMKRPDGNTPVMNWIDDKTREIGYDYKRKKLNAAWYGVPQKRNRIIFVGWRSGMAMPRFPPPPTRAEHPYMTILGNRVPKFKTVRQAFREIPDNAPNQDLVYEFKKDDYIERVKKLDPGESVYDYGDSHRKLKWDAPAFTMKENHGSIAIHPEEIRMINLREMATLQDFPVYYEFIGNNREIAKIIGNAVPRGLALAVAREIMKANNNANND